LGLIVDFYKKRIYPNQTGWEGTHEKHHHFGRGIAGRIFIFIGRFCE
jgi:hypothetical protein